MVGIIMPWDSFSAHFHSAATKIILRLVILLWKAHNAVCNYSMQQLHSD